MNHPNLDQTLRQLRLSGLLQTLPVRLQEAAANRLSHAEFLELIFQDELTVRQEPTGIGIAGWKEWSDAAMSVRVAARFSRIEKDTPWHEPN